MTESRSWKPDYGYRSGDGTPMTIWHGRILRAWLPETVDAADAETLLRSREGIALLDRVAAGHTVEWDGNNHVGRMTGDASDAFDSIVDDLSAQTLIEESAGVWEAGDWLSESIIYGGGHVNVGNNGIVTARTPDAALQALAAIIDAEAATDYVSLRGTYNYLELLRTEIRDGGR